MKYQLLLDRTGRSPALSRWMVTVPLLLLGLSGSGCTGLIAPIQTIPASRVPPELLAIPVANDRVLEYPRLRQTEPEDYILGKDDVLGIHIEGLFTGLDPTAPQVPPVTMPEPGSDLSPGIGLPYPVRDDGTVSMPFVGPIAVKGLTLAQAEEVIGRVYVEKGMLQEGQRPIVSLMRKRTTKVFVIRQDNMFGGGGGGNNIAGFQMTRQAISERTDLSSRGYVLQLPAYRNDLLNALSETGGMPGVNAKAEVKILRSDKVDPRRRDEALRNFYLQYGTSNVGGTLPDLPDDENVVKIPLRLKPGQFPKFTEQDIILNEGDVVLVETRETEVYYTSGLLFAGEFLLPRDKDTDVLNAVAIAGGGIGAFQQGRGGGGFAAGLSGGIGSVPPSQLIIMRPLPGNRQIAIEVDLIRAINDPRERILIQANDTLILRHKPREELLNFSIGTFFTFGIRELFN
jgi:hypothetical protein